MLNKLSGYNNPAFYVLFGIACIISITMFFEWGVRYGEVIFSLAFFAIAFGFGKRSKLKPLEVFEKKGGKENE